MDLRPAIDSWLAGSRRMLEPNWARYTAANAYTPTIRSYEGSPRVSSRLGSARTASLARSSARYWIALVSLLFIAPGLITLRIGLVLVTPIVFLQLRARQGPSEA